MTHAQFLRRLSVIASAALLVTSIGASSLYAQSASGSPANADGTPAKKTVKKTTAKPSAERPRKATQNNGSGAMQGFRPDPAFNY